MNELKSRVEGREISRFEQALGVATVRFRRRIRAPSVARTVAAILGLGKLRRSRFNIFLNIISDSESVTGVRDRRLRNPLALD